MTLTPHYRDDNVTLYAGDCLDVLADLPDASVDSVVTDPPYGLEFMNKDWDSFDDKAKRLKWRNGSESEADAAYLAERASAFTKRFRRRPDAYVAGTPFQNWCELWARECLRVLKPGGHILAFGGTRTWHRLAVAIEDAGFEIRDNIAWLYGSGFPKSLDVSKAIDKAAGAEREVVGYREDFRAKVAAERKRGVSNSHHFNEKHDPGRGCYVNPDEVGKITAPATDDAKRWSGWGTALKPAFEPVVVGRKPLSGTVAANVLAHGVGALNIDGCRVASDEPIAAHLGTNGADGVTFGKRRDYTVGSHNSENVHNKGRWPSNVVVDEVAAEEIDRQSGNVKGQVGMKKTNGGHRFIEGDTESVQKFDYGTTDEGGASRFFPTFKYQAKAPTEERPTADGIAHPTVKPLDLMRWLIRLVTPPGGTVLEPFAGSGTTAEAAIHEHMRCIAIEREPDYLPLIVNRLTKPMEIGFDFGEGA